MIYKPCKIHNRIVCTICHPVDFVTPINDQYYMSYYAYWSNHGCESPKNHREIAAMWTDNDPEIVKDYQSGGCRLSA